jgi:hypothetical protein
MFVAATSELSGQVTNVKLANRAQIPSTNSLLQIVAPTSGKRCLGEPLAQEMGHLRGYLRRTGSWDAVTAEIDPNVLGSHFFRLAATLFQ